MSKKTKRTIAIAVAAIVLIAAAVTVFLVLSANSKGYRSISIAEIFGKVITQNGGKTYEAYKNMRLSDGYALTTEPDSYTRMVLDDDKYVKLEQESHAIFEALGDSKKHLTTIRLEKGALTTEITKPLSENESYVVNTPNAVLAVRGTLFRVEVKQERNGDYYCDVYTYGGSVVSHRIMPDGTHVDEEILIPAGFKATIKMDEVITVYLEEKIEVEKDNIDPLHISEVNDEDLVNVYNASRHGHEMFLPTKELWDEISDRDIDLSKYKSVYDGTDIPPFISGNNYNTGDSGNSGINSEGTPNSSKTFDSSDVSENSEQADDSSVDNSSSSTENPGEPSIGSNDSNTHDTEPDSRPPQSSASSPSSEPTPSESEESTSTSGDSEPESSEETPSSTTSSDLESSSVPAESTPPYTPPSVPSTPSVPTVHTHTPVTHTVPATCTEAGCTTVKCSACGEVISSESISPLGHSANTITMSSTCTEHGEEKQVCVRCDAVLGLRELPLAEHTEVTTTVLATCTEAGCTTVKCSACGEVISSESISPLGHSANTITTPSTCTEHGEEKQVCVRCDAVLGLRELPLAEHTEITETEGNIETVKCSVCGEIIRQTNINSGVVYPVAINAENFPDEAFREYVTTNFDKDGNGNLSQEECEAVTELYVNPYCMEAKSLKGIENFSKLLVLQCPCTQITELDISKNTALTELYCDETPITVLDVSKNTELTWLQCRDTQIKTLNISKNTKLKTLFCDNTQISALDISNNVLLKDLMCGNCSLAYIDGSNNPSLIPYTEGNTYSIHVENGVFDAKTISGLDFKRISSVEVIDGLEYDWNTGVFSNIYPDITIGYTYIYRDNISATGFRFVPDETSTFAPETPSITYPVPIDEEHFPDDVFRQYVSENFDTNNDGELSAEECNAVTEIDVGGSQQTDGGITSLDGIEIFSKLIYLNCQYNNDITSLDVSKYIALKDLRCHGTQIASLDVSKNTKLTSLYCSDTEISELDVCNNTMLELLWCSDTKITTLDVSNNAMLSSLSCSRTQITSLDVSKNMMLEGLVCSGTKINNLNIKNNHTLKHLGCSFTQITSLDVSNNTALTYLECYKTQVTSLDISNNTALKTLYCYNTQIPFVDISNNPKLTSLPDVYGNKYPIPAETLQFDITSDMNFAGFDPTRVSNVRGADFSSESGIFDNFTADEITYTYDCKGTGESTFMKTFTLVRTAAVSTASISADDEDDNFAALPPDDTDTTPPPSSADTGAAALPEDAALPPEDIKGLRYLPLGILALLRDRKRKKLYVIRKAEI